MRDKVRDGNVACRQHAAIRNGMKRITKRTGETKKQLKAVRESCVNVD